MAKEDKATKVQVEQRVTTVYQLLLCGASRSDIFRYVSELQKKHLADRVEFPDPWNITERQIENYIASANKRFEEASKTHRKRIFGRTIARREDLYQRALRLQDLGKALAIDQDTAKLYDLYTTENKAAQLAAQVALLEHKLEEFQKKEVLLAFLKEHATTEVYEEVIRLLAGGPAKKSEGGSNIRLQWEDARQSGDDPGADPVSAADGDSEPSSPV